MLQKSGRLINLLWSDEAASSVEYSLLAAAIAAVIAVMVYALGGTVANYFSTYNAALSSHSS
jgi:Flp pilus assembly pilin Flp